MDEDGHTSVVLHADLDCFHAAAAISCLLATMECNCAARNFLQWPGSTMWGLHGDILEIPTRDHARSLAQRERALLPDHPIALADHVAPLRVALHHPLDARVHQLLRTNLARERPAFAHPRILHRHLDALDLIIWTVNVFGKFLNFFAKAPTAARALRTINPAAQIHALQERFDPETETIFDSSFFNSIAGVFSAVDTSSSRLYLDARCVSYRRPMVDGGKHGTKGSVQVRTSTP